MLIDKEVPFSVLDLMADFKLLDTSGEAQRLYDKSAEECSRLALRSTSRYDKKSRPSKNQTILAIGAPVW